MGDEDLKKKSLSSVKLLALPLSITYLIKFIQTPVLAIFLSPADFGIWGLANVLITAMESLTEVGIQKLLIQRDTMKKSFIRSIWGFIERTFHYRRSACYRPLLRLLCRLSGRPIHFYSGYYCAHFTRFHHSCSLPG